MEPHNRKYFIQQYSGQEYQHGGIGYTDAERIFAEEGYEPVLFPCQDNFSLLAKLKRLLYLFRMINTIKKRSVIIFIFPVYARMNRLLLKFLTRKGATPVCFIGDINGLKDGNDELLKKEISFFRRFENFIVHNENMKQWLEKQVPGCKATVIDFFDFLAEPAAQAGVLSSHIVFAGNLEKSGFLEKLSLLSERSPSLFFHLYGHSRTQLIMQQKNVKWEGAGSPYELPGQLKGSFGLVWDGDGIDKPSGSLGDYMHYISHHKLSLYIISGLPVIVPAMAGSATLVNKYKIGFTVNSLFEVEEKINRLSPGEYRQMQENMKPLAARISRGEGLKDALKANHK